MPTPLALAASDKRTPSVNARKPRSSCSSMFLVSPRSIQASYPPSPSSPFWIAASSRRAASDNEPPCSKKAFASLSGDRGDEDGSRYLLFDSVQFDKRGRDVSDRTHRTHIRPEWASHHRYTWIGGHSH